MALAAKRFFINRYPDHAGEDSLAQLDASKLFLKHKAIETINKIFDRQRTSVLDCDGGVYVGITGIAYMSYYLTKFPTFENHKLDWLEKGEDYINQVLSYIEHPRYIQDQSLKHSFLLGNAGVFAVTAFVMSALEENEQCEANLNKYAGMAHSILGQNFLKNGSDELFVGRAGYICGALALNKFFEKEIVPIDYLHKVCQSIIVSGKQYSATHQSNSPLMFSYYNTEYLGAGHGLSAILQMLMSVPGFLDLSPEYEADVRGAVDFLLSLQLPNGNFPCAMDEVDTPRPECEQLVHWCHGAPGIVYLMAKAFLKWQDEKYLRSCVLCGDLIWSKGLLRKGPGLCHGIAGSGYVFILLYRLTMDSKHLHRAMKFANFLFSDDFKKARTPDSPYSLFEGWAGAAIFIADLIHIETAHFPFFDVFN